MSHKVSSFQGVLIRESFYPGFHTGFFGVCVWGGGGGGGGGGEVCGGLQILSQGLKLTRT